MPLIEQISYPVNCTENWMTSCTLSINTSVCYVFLALIILLGFFLLNDLQIPTPPPPSKKADGKIFLAYVSDDLRRKKN